jgi:hypothetical protein
MSENISQINPVCRQMLNCRLTGNITPISWFRNILTKSGKPDVVAIILLSDIVYWYTPVMTRDEHSGDVIGIQQKFKADQLQKTYQEYADIFGFSKNQIKNAIDNLCAQGFITREFRHIKTGTGLAITNVMYIQPIYEKIVKISNKIRSPQKVRGYPPKKLGDTPPKSGGTSPQKDGGHPPEKSGVIPPKNGGTYTEITTKNSTENTTTTTTTGKSAVVSSKNNFSRRAQSRIPSNYQDHRDVLLSLEKYLRSHGEPFVITELDYAAAHSTKAGGFPAFLKRSLTNGWGTESLKVQQAVENEKCQKEHRQRESERQARKAEQKRIAEIKAQDRRIDSKVQETMAHLSSSELDRIKAEALAEAESKIAKPKKQQGQIWAAAKEKLVVLQDHERQELYETAQATVEASIGSLIGSNHPGFQRAVDNQVLKEIQKRYPLKTPLVCRWQSTVQTEAQRIVKSLIINNYGPFNIDHAVEAP